MWTQYFDSTTNAAIALLVSGKTHAHKRDEIHVYELTVFNV